jgi:hypothetical protein
MRAPQEVAIHSLIPILLYFSSFDIFLLDLHGGERKTDLELARLHFFIRLCLYAFLAMCARFKVMDRQEWMYRTSRLDFVLPGLGEKVCCCCEKASSESKAAAHHLSV